ncbi:MAG: phage major capsid protein [Candidatus Borkfalkiaceae bacterium]|nr:phage major capsid protein [Clostridia bacterium]MDY6223224.1 phage major capsid protein [Christensenellaceae bacterium]
MVTVTSANEALKNYYLDAVSEALNKKVNPLLAKIKKTTADVWGKDVRKLVRYGMSGGVSAGDETGNLPVSGGNNCVQFVSTLKNLYGTLEISDKAIRASAGNEGAFVNLLNDEMQALIKSSEFNFGRMLYGDGSGKLAGASVSSTDETAGVVSLDDVSNIYEGMIIDFCTSSGVRIGGCTSKEILKVDRANKKITISGSPFDSDTLPAGAYVALQGSSVKELTGLGALFSSSDTLYGVTRADHTWMTPYSLASTGAFDISKFQKAVDTIEQQSGGRINFAVCSFGVKRAVYNYLVSSGVTPEVKEIENGFKAIMLDGIPVVADRFCPASTMYLLNTDDFCLHQLCDWQWLENENGSILKQIAGKPAYSATLVKYAELLCVRPNGQGVLRGVTEA